MGGLCASGGGPALPSELPLAGPSFSWASLGELLRSAAGRGWARLQARALRRGVAALRVIAPVDGS